MIERKIIIYLITSTDFLRQIRNIWDVSYLESPTAKRLASWVWEYFEKFDKAPGRNIESIFYEKVASSKISKEITNEIEEEILPGLSEEYEQESFNLDYAIAQSKKHFRERRLILYCDTLQALIASSQIEEAEKNACDFKPIPDASDTDIDLSSNAVLEKIEKAFEAQADPLLKWPKQLGKFWNDQFVRGAFIAFMASEKRGKTFLMIEIALRACKKYKVAFFQAGDMSEGQQLMRIAINLTGKSNKEKYCVASHEPLRDCIHNQRNTCRKKERECDFGVFDNMTEEMIREEVTKDALVDALKENPDYKPCYNCEEYEDAHWGVPWIKETPAISPLKKEEAKDVYSEFFIKHKRKFRLSTHANGSLSVKQIKAILGIWEKEDGFAPDFIIIDYADLLVCDARVEFRHQQNQIWKDLRGLNQEKNCILITATQADSKSYDQHRLKLSNFSEDKRKYGHVTAMYGLNQDPKDREKKIGLMRINKLILREDEFSSADEIVVLQNLKRGRPIIGSYL